MNHDDIFAQFVGKDKIQPVSVIKTEDGFRLLYKEGRKWEHVDCEDRQVLDEILISFGGKNPETCRTESRFLDLAKEWGSDDLNDLGHRITKVRLIGDRIVRSKVIPVYFPEGTGASGTIQSKRSHEKDMASLLMRDTEHVEITRSFDSPKEFDALATFLLSDPALKDLHWRVDLIGTESREVSKQCIWKRCRAGDGTKRMVLELQEIDGVGYEQCVRQDLFDAAGDMFDAPCKAIKVKPKHEQTKKICLFAAEDGTVDLAAYEAAT